jgi:redox-sensitive bicupin YhaK (pirin superfamily)
MGFGSLRVINEDRVAPGGGFPRHPHRDMEIISYVLDGALEHKDSMGHGSVIRAGEIQYMSAGKGVLHSEYNASDSEPLHFLQIWIIPSQRGTEPGYGQKQIDEAARQNAWLTLASPDGRDGSIVVKQDARLLSAKLGAGAELGYEHEPGRGLWLQVARGEVNAETSDGSEHLVAGDALGLLDERLALSTLESAELLLFDLAGASM